MRVYRSDEFTDKGIYLFRVNVTEERGNEIEEAHTHAFTELVYVLSGEAVHTVNGRTFTLGAGGLILIREGETHAFRAEKPPYSYANLMLAEGVLSETSMGGMLVALDLPLRYARLEGESRASFEHVLALMLDESLVRRENHLSVMKKAADLLFSLLARHMGASGEERGAHRARFVALTALMEDELHAKHTLESLAERAGYDPAYLCRAFKREYGISPMVYLSRRRVERAAVLLRTTHASLAEIRESCGFSDRTAMARAFTRVFGCPPAEYAKIVRSEKVKK